MNSAYALTQENLLRTLPPVLQNDEKLLALATAASAAILRMRENAEKAKIYTCIDSLPEELLDILAVDFKVDWWNPEYAIEEKRQTLKDSWRVHRYLGTKYAVETAISAIYEAAKVSEWFEYGGKPFHFKILIDAMYESADSEKHRQVLERVQYYKNLRSVLEGVEYTAQPTCRATAYIVPAVVSMAIKMEMKVNVYGLE